MKGLAFLEQVDHHRKAAIYAAAHDGKLRNFVYHEELGECRETFSRLVQDVQKGEIGVILTPEAACLAIETSPGWMEAFIHKGNTRGRGAPPARSSMPSRRVLSQLPTSSGERTGSWSPASRARTRKRPSIVFPAGRSGKTWTCSRWGIGKSSWMSWPPMGLTRRAAGALFLLNEKTGSPVRSSKRRRWPRKQLMQ